MKEMTRMAKKATLIFAMAMPVLSASVFGVVPAEAAKCSHDYKISSTVYSTCQKAGYKKYVCKKCKKVKTDTLAKASHRWAYIGSKAATCTNPGTKTKWCSWCNKKVTEQASNALGHKMVVVGKSNGKVKLKCTKCSKVQYK